MSYSLRLAGFAVAGTRAESEAAIASVFGPDAAVFSKAVGPIGADAVTGWFLATKTRQEVLPYYTAMTRAAHKTMTSSETLDPDGMGQEIREAAVLRGAWNIYLDQNDPGRQGTFTEWLTSLGLEMKEHSLFGDQPIDAAIFAAQAAEPVLTPAEIADVGARVLLEYNAL